MIDTQIYKKPTLLNIVIGVIVTLIQEKCCLKNNFNARPKIGKYVLVGEITKENPFKKFSTGIYKYKGKKVFIKTWQGKIRDLSYYSLVNEYITHNILQKIINKKNSKIKIPQLICAIGEDNALSLVFEYIDGTKLKSLSLLEQSKIVISIANELERISSFLTIEEKNQFMKRSVLFYIFTFPLITLVACVCNMEESISILKLFFKSFLSVPSLFTSKNQMILSHRDITLENILLSKNNIILLDGERMVLTHQLYDMSYLSVVPKLENLRKVLADFLTKHTNKFLKNYILFHLMTDPSNPDEYKAYFKLTLKEVNNLYGKK